MKILFLIVSFISLLAFQLHKPLLQSFALAQNTQNIQPSFVCGGSTFNICPSTAVSIIPPAVSTVPPLNTGQPISPTPSTLNPCPTQTQSPVTTNTLRKRHRPPQKGFFQEIMQFLLTFINYILQLFGISPITSQPTTQPAAVTPAATTGNNTTPLTVPCPSQSLLPSIVQPSAAQPTAAINPTSGPISSPSVSQPVSISGAPGNAINLTNWKLQLPTGAQGAVTEITQPQLNTYSIDPWYLPGTSGGTRFRAPVNGVTTSGSNYARSELREMSGGAQANWSSGTGTSTMVVEEAITAVPKTKQQVIAAQIHDETSYTAAIRLEFPKLNLDMKNPNATITLDPNYTLGKRFQVRFEVSNNQTRVFYNNSASPVYTIPKSYNGYFKAGAYVQSNCSTETSGPCDASNYGEVVIYNLTVSHQ